MVEMSVSEDQAIDFLGVQRQVLPIAFAPFFLALEESAVDQHLKTAAAGCVAADVDQVFRSSYRAGRAEKLNV